MKFSTFNSTWNLFLGIAVEAAEAQDNFVGFFDDPHKFKGSGYRLGSGMYGSVYESINPKYVIKVSDKLDRDGWLYYALECLALGEKRKSWMPEIKMLMIDESMGIAYSVIERLDDNCCSRDKPWIQDGLDDTAYILNCITENTNIPCEIKDSLSDYVTNFGREFGKDRNSVRFDAHEENWMFRKSDGSLVLTDPFAHGIPWMWTKRFARACSKRFPNQVKFIST